MDLAPLEAFRVDTATDILTEQEIFDNWDKVEAADRKEHKQFVENSVWRLNVTGEVKRRQSSSN